MVNVIAGPAIGWQPETLDVRVIADEAMSLGDVCMFDFVQDGNAANFIIGDVLSCFARVRDPDTGSVALNGLNNGVFGILLEDIAAAGTGRVRLRGVVLANVDGATALGTALIAATDNQLDVATEASEAKVIAIALMADAPTNWATVLFDGINGFAQAASGA